MSDLLSFRASVRPRDRSRSALQLPQEVEEAERGDLAGRRQAGLQLLLQGGETDGRLGEIQILYFASQRDLLQSQIFLSTHRIADPPAPDSDVRSRAGEAGHIRFELLCRKRYATLVIPLQCIAKGDQMAEDAVDGNRCAIRTEQCCAVRRPQNAQLLGGP